MSCKLRREDKVDDETIPDNTIEPEFCTYPFRIAVRQFKIHLNRVNLIYGEANAFILGNLLVKSTSIFVTWKLVSNFSQVIFLNLGLFAFQLLYDILLIFSFTRRIYSQMYHWHQFLYVLLGFLSCGLLFLGIFTEHFALQVLPGIFLMLMAFMLIRNASKVWIHRQSGIMSIFLQYISYSVLLFVRAKEGNKTDLEGQLFIVGAVYIVFSMMRGLFVLLDLCGCIEGTGLFFCIWTNLATNNKKRSKILIFIDLVEDSTIGLYLMGFREKLPKYFYPAIIVMSFQLLSYIFASGLFQIKSLTLPTGSNSSSMIQTPATTKSEPVEMTIHEALQAKMNEEVEVSSNLEQKGFMDDFFGTKFEYFSALANEREKLPESTLCYICCLEQANTVVKPCKHRGCCETCLLRYLEHDTRCPLDRWQIDRFLVLQKTSHSERIVRKYVLI